MSIFSHREIERRMEALRSRLGDCDAGVFFSFTHVYYMSGAPILPWGRPAVTIVPRHGDPVIISGKADAQNIADNSPIQEIIAYGDIEGPNARVAVAHLADVMERRGLKRIGIDAFYTPLGLVDLLKARRPGCRVDDITAVVEDMRLVNSDPELQLIRIATSVADHGMQAYLSEARLGQTEIELAGRVTQEMARFAAAHHPDLGITFNCYSQQGTRTFEPHAAAAGHPLVAGQLLCVVVEASAAHYMAAVERAVALGDLRPDQQHYYDAVVSALAETLRICGPGVSCSQVDRRSQEVFRQAGYADFLCGTGLSRGLLNAFEGRLDKSNLRSYNDTPLHADMVLSLEPYAIAPGVGAQRHCEMVRITATGHEVLSRAPAGYLRIG